MVIYMSEEFDELENIAETTTYATGRQDGRGTKVGGNAGNVNMFSRMDRIQRSKGMFARVKRKPVTLPALPPFKDE